MLSSLLSQTQPKPQLASATITKLCDRLTNGTLLEDRRAAVLGLKGFSREYREAVAAGGLRGLLESLQRDTEDPETCRAILETLLILFLPGSGDSDRGSGSNGSGPSPQDLGSPVRFSRSKYKQYKSPLLLRSQSQATDDISLWLTDEFTQKQENILSLIDLVKSSHDMFIKLYSLQLLSAIISNRPSRSQECILSAPLGISSLVTCLSDHHEVVRNEAILLLLYLVNDHFDLQKLVAFEGTFDKLFDIVHSEGGIEGGVVVQDALSLMSNLLRYNMSNQNHFRETNCVKKLARLLQLHDTVLDSQSTANLIMILDMCRLFVIEDHWSTPVNQKALAAAGILISVLQIAFGPVTPLSLRSSALMTAAALVRGNVPIQEEALGVDVPYIDLSVALNLEREAEIVPVADALLSWSLLSTSIHTFDLRVSAQICFNAMFHGNTEAKVGFLKEQVDSYPGSIKILESSSSSDGEKSSSVDAEAKQSDESEPPVQPRVGTANLLAALVDYDPDARLNPYKTWFASVILSHLFDSTTEVRDFVRDLSIGDEDSGEEVVTSIQAMSGMLVTSLQFEDLRIAIAYLMLLTIWLYDDTKAVNAFLGESSSVQALITCSTHASNNDPLVEAMATVLLGVAYDFSGSESPISRYVYRLRFAHSNKRIDLHSLLMKSVGRDQYVLKVKKLREHPFFKDYDIDGVFTYTRDKTGLPQVFLDYAYVDLVKENISRIQKAFDRDPNVEPNSRVSLEMYDELQSEHLNTLKELEDLRQRLSETDASNLEKIAVLQDRITQTESALEQTQVELEDIKHSKIQLDTTHQEVSKSLQNLLETHKTLETTHKQTSDSLKKATALTEEQKQREKQLTAQVTALSRDKEKAEAGINKMNRELFGLTKAKEDLEKEGKSLNKKIQELESQIKKSADKEARLSSDLKAMAVSRDQHKNETKQYAAKLESLAAVRQSTSAELESQKLQLVELESLKDTLISKLQSAANQIELLKSTRDELDASLKNKESDLETERRENETLRKTVEALKEEKVSLQARIDDVLLELDDILTSKESLESELAVAQERITELEQGSADSETLKRHLEEAKEAVEISNQELEKLRNQHSALEAEARDLRAAHEQLTLTSSTQIGDLNAKHEDLVTKTSAEIQDLKSKHEKLVNESSSQIADIKAKREAVLSLNVELTQKHETLIKATSAELDDLKAKHAAAVVSNKDLKAQHEQSIKDHDSIAQKLEASAEVVKGLESKITATTSDYEEKIKQLDAENKLSISNLESKHAAALDEVKGQHKTANDGLKELREAHSNAISELQLKSAERSNDMKKQLDAAKSETAELMEQLAKSRGNVVELQEKYDASVSEIESLNSTVESLKASATELESSNADLKSLNANLDAKVKALQQEIEAHTGSRDDEIEKYKKLWQEKDSELLKNQEELRSTRDKADKEIEDHKVKASELEKNLEKAKKLASGLHEKHKAAVASLEEKLGAHESTIGAHVKSISELEGQLKSEREDTTSLKSDISTLKLESQKAKESHENAVRSLEEKLSLRASLSDDLNGRMTTLQREHESLVSTLEAAVKEANDKAAALDEQLAEKQKEHDDLQKSMVALESADAVTKSEHEALVAKMTDLHSKHADTTSELQSALSATKTSDEEVALLKKRLSEAESKLEADAKSARELAAVSESSYEDRIAELTEQLKSTESLLEKRSTSQVELDAANDKLAEANVKITGLEKQLQHRPESSAVEMVPKSELDDLMLVLGDLDDRKEKYRQRLRALGESVSDEESGDDDGDEDDDDDDDNDSVE